MSGPRWRADVRAGSWYEYRVTGANLELAQLLPPSRQPWAPFGGRSDSDDGFEPNWWARLVWPAREPVANRFFALLDSSGMHLARLHLDWDFPAGVYPSADAARTRPMLEIQFIEVNHRFRRKGIGTLLVQRTQEAFPDRQLMALSEADRFWESLGWSRHLHVEDDRSGRYRPLYLAP